MHKNSKNHNGRGKDTDVDDFDLIELDVGREAGKKSQQHQQYQHQKQPSRDSSSDSDNEEYNSAEDNNEEKESDSSDEEYQSFVANPNKPNTFIEAMGAEKGKSEDINVDDIPFEVNSFTSTPPNNTTQKQATPSPSSSAPPKRKPGAIKLSDRKIEVVSVVSYAAIGNISFSHWVYKVITKFVYDEDVVIREIYHRFSDFHGLYNRLYSFKEFCALVPMPPAKTIIPYTSESIVQERCKDLDVWLKKLCKVKALIQKDTTRTLIYEFLFDGERIDGRTYVNTIDDQPSTTFQMIAGVGRRIAENSQYVIGKAMQKTDFSPYDDYENLSLSLQKQGLQPKLFPWKKYVVTIYGTTSAGKSSLVNHLFTLPCTRSGGTQIDIGYTIFETLPSSEFYQISELSGKNVTFTEDQLLEPLPDTWEKIRTDPRYGTVFYINEDLERFRRQFGEQFSTIKQYNKLKSVFINEDYLRGTEEDIELAKKLIVIDSKGLDQTAKDLLSVTTPAELEIQKVNVQMMQIFNQLSNKILFLVPYHDLHNCAEQLATFELSIVCSFDNGNMMEERLKEIQQTQMEKEKTKVAQDGAGIGAQLIGYVMQPVMGLSYDIIKNVASYVYTTAVGTEPRRKSHAASLGNELWDKTRFLITKIDEFYIDQEKDEAEKLKMLYYNLGRAFSGHRRYIEAPTYDRFIQIGLPERNYRNRKKGKRLSVLHKELASDKKTTGELFTFKSALKYEACSLFSYDKRLDEVIISMCDQLDENYQNNGGVLQQAGKWWNDYVHQARQRAKARMLVYN